MADGASVLIIVPTHDHASTLDLAVTSALNQTIVDLDIVIIGDGVGDDTRDVASELIRADGRVRLIDRPKSSGKGEFIRHEVISASSAEVVTYLGDDDLLLADHVEEMVGLLEDHDFAHPFPIFVEADEQLVAYPADLSDPACVEWHLEPKFNTIGLTGAAHTTAMYRCLPAGWVEPPPGRWSDHFFWGQIFTQPGVRLVTSKRATVIKPPASMRVDFTPAMRRQSLERWVARTADAGFRAMWDVEVTDAIRRSAVTNHIWTARHHETILQLRRELDACRGG